MPCSNECGVLTMHGQLPQPSEARSEITAPTETNAPSETTEARSDRLEEVDEFLQQPENPALLTSSRSSGPPACRARPGKPKKVRFLSFLFYAKMKHNTCTAVVKSSSSSAPGVRSRACSRVPTATSDLDVPAASRTAKTESGDVKAGQHTLLQFGHLSDFLQNLGKSHLDT